MTTTPTREQLIDKIRGALTLGMGLADALRCLDLLVASQPSAAPEAASEVRCNACGYVFSRSRGHCPDCGQPVRYIAAAPSPLPRGVELTPDYSEMSREALERHATRMAQALADDGPRKFYDRYASGPLMTPSCLCCGKLPDEVAIKHMELPGIVVCKACRDSALAAKPAEAEPDVVCWEQGKPDSIDRAMSAETEPADWLAAFDQYARQFTYRSHPAEPKHFPKTAPWFEAGYRAGIAALSQKHTPSSTTDKGEQKP